MLRDNKRGESIIATTKTSEELRSAQWYRGTGPESFKHRARTNQMGYSYVDYQGKPIIGIINTWSDISPCHSHFRVRVEDVKRGVWQAGGFPLELPAISLSEPFQKPSTMLYRNLLSMETEELLRSYPIDGAVLMGGCDKTTPALMMGAISVDLPTIFVSAGPMLHTTWNGKTLGSTADVQQLVEDPSQEQISDCELRKLEESLSRSPGHCTTMATASTMTAAVEALGMMLPGASSTLAVEAAHSRMSAASGRQIVEMVWRDRKPSDIIDDHAYDNAVTTVLALGGSTNAIIHLVAMAGRSGIGLAPERFDELARSVPILADMRPGGTHLMEDFSRAGGLLALLERIRNLLHCQSITVNGKTLGENIRGSKVLNDQVIRTFEDPLFMDGGIAFLRGNLAPEGTILKYATADPYLLGHSGPAVVFDDHDDLRRRINSDSLQVSADSVLVLRNSGPLGGPGMPEWGTIPIPKKLRARGVHDLVRISDARMSGVGTGTCLVHVSPESYAGGPLSLVETGDQIELDTPNRTINMCIPDKVLKERKEKRKPLEPHYTRGYGAMYSRHVLQAERGCDFDFLL